GRTPPDEVEVYEVRRHQEAIAASADLLDGLAAIFGILRIPSPRPDTPDETARARPRLLERIALLGAEPKRPIHDCETSLGVDPRQRVGHVDECLPLEIDQATGGATVGERFIRFDSTRVERDHIHR